MKELVNKIGAFIMACIVLFSTFSFTVHEHYCGDELKDTSFFVKADDCKMPMQMNDAQPMCNLHETQKPCCEDRSSVLEGQDELKISFNELTTDQQLFTAVLITTYVNLFTEFELEDTSFLEYPPPLIVQQIYKLDESYLI